MHETLFMSFIENFFKIEWKGGKYSRECILPFKILHKYHMNLLYTKWIKYLQDFCTSEVTTRGIIIDLKDICTMLNTLISLNAKNN